jgi:hypothetical protein
MGVWSPQSSALLHFVKKPHFGAPLLAKKVQKGVSALLLHFLHFVTRAVTPVQAVFCSLMK